MPRLRLYCILSLLLTTTALVGWSQVVSATLLGTVTDASGAVVPNAKVTITETQTSVVHTEQTNASGNYIVPNLPPGVYAVTVEATGFKKESRRDIALRVDTNTRVDVQLQPGSMTETVEVTGAPPMLQTDSASTGQTIERSRAGQRSPDQFESKLPEPANPGAGSRARSGAAFPVLQCVGIAANRSQRPRAAGKQLHDRGYGR